MAMLNNQMVYIWCFWDQGNDPCRRMRCSFKPRTWPHRIIATSLVSTPYDVHTLGPSGVELGAWTMARRMGGSGVQYTMCFKAQGWYTMLSLIHINYTNREHDGVCSWSIQTGMFCQLGCVALLEINTLIHWTTHRRMWKKQGKQ
jgi:hypothetical protein